MNMYKAKRDASRSCGGATPRPDAYLPPKGKADPRVDEEQEEREWWYDEKVPWKEGAIPGDVSPGGRRY